MSLAVDEHRRYLTDRPRIEAFRRAIREVVRTGTVVADVGSGSGILGLLACEAGAGRVYSIEATGMIELARAVAARNGFADRLRFVHAESVEVELPEQVDVLVCDQVGHFGFEAGLFDFVSDARRRFLKPGGAMVPARVRLQIAPVSDPELAAGVRFWCERPAGFDMSPAHAWAANTGYPTKLEADQCLGASAVAADVDVIGFTGQPLVLEVSLPIATRGLLDGIGGWFTADLAPGVTLTNSPLSPDRIDRRNVYFPIDPVAVEPGDLLAVRMRILPTEVVVSWRGEVTRAGRALASFKRSTVAGMLLSRDDLARQRPGYVPTLTPRGRARMTVLELCDGARPLADVERELFERHRDLFATPAEAAAFAAEVVTRYTR
ncbi:MAG: methyltransferase domain-containing protein [Vicinamibacterales bacterium]